MARKSGRRGGAEVEVLEWNEDEKKLTVEQDEKIVLSEETHEPVDVDELTERVAQELGIEQRSDSKKLFEKTLENYADIYESDEIVEYSMTRAIKNKISDETSGNLDKISGIDIDQKEKDLVLKIYAVPETPHT